MEERKLKVLLLHNTMAHYRIPIWNLIAEKCDFTVSYTIGKGVPAEFAGKCKFKPLYLPAWQWGRWTIHKANITKLTSQYDVVLIYGDISWLKLATFPWNPFRKMPCAFWSLGVSASRDKPYDQVKHWDWIRKTIYNAADACIFYTDYPVKKYVKMGVPAEKLFVAHNTVAVKKIVPAEDKNSLLFIGTLYPQKGLGDLLNAYKNLAGTGLKLPILNILGGGSEFENIKNFIAENQLENLIFLRGAIYEIDKKAEFFKTALATISPKQAGLAVQESLGYGVPFITGENAITGGERFDVIEGETGRYITAGTSLEDILRDIVANPEKYKEMGKNAYDFYWRERKPEDMANGAWQAIQYLASLKK